MGISVFPAPGGGVTQKVQEFTSTGTFTAPANVSAIKLIMFGGGGGGGRTYGYDVYNVGGGGGGGGTSHGLNFGSCGGANGSLNAVPSNAAANSAGGGGGSGTTTATNYNGSNGGSGYALIEYWS